jgi:putative transposase
LTHHNVSARWNRVDQGSEFVSRDLDLWAYQRGVTLDFSRPGKPTDNAFIEAFNGRVRAAQRPLVP